MGFRLRLKFTGLCSLAPFPSPQMAIFPDSRDFSYGGMKMPHIPAILVPEENYGSTTRTSTFPIEHGERYEAGPIIGFELGEERVNLSDGGTPWPPILNVNDPLEDCPTFDYDEGSPLWVADMKDCGAGPMRADAFSGVPKKGLVVASLTLPSNSVPYTWTFALLDDSSKIVHWKFAPLTGMTPPDPSALAEVIAIERWIDGDTVTIVCDGGNIVIKPSVAVRSASLRRGAAADSPEANVWFVNMPKEDIQKDTSSHRPKRDPDYHFSEHYKLSIDSTPRFQPEADGDCGKPPVGSVSAPKCPPTFYAKVAPKADRARRER